MNEKTRLWKFHIAIYVIPFALALLIVSACVDSLVGSSGRNGKGLPAATMGISRDNKDSSSVGIISPDGILLREYKYLTANSYQYDISGCPRYFNYIYGYPTADTITGDFNGDGKQEKAWFKDRGYNTFTDCKRNFGKSACKGIIRFSEKSIRELVIDYCPMGYFKNEGDINCDGKDEIGVLPGWFLSGCRGYFLLTYNKNRWIDSCPPVSSTMNMREAGIPPVEKDTAGKGYAIVRESMIGYLGKNPGHKIPSEYTNLRCCSWSYVVEYKIKLK